MTFLFWRANAASCGGMVKTTWTEGVGSSSTARDGPQDLEVGPAEPRTVSLDEVCTCSANNVGHLELWPTHLLLLGRPAFLEHQRIQRTGRGMQVPLREVEIASGFFQIVMA